VVALLHDLRYAWRGWSRSPGAAAIILLTIGVGTGVNATVFSLVRALLFRAPAGVGDPSRLVAVFTREFGGEPFGYSSYLDFVSLQEHTSAFESLGAIDDRGPASLHVADSMHSVRVASVSWDLFRVLQLEPTRGRTIGSVDIGTNPAPAVIAFTLWRTAFNQDEKTVGRAVTIDGREYRIVGIAPPGFHGLQLGREYDVWIPLGDLGVPAERGNRRLTIVGRLRPGASLSDAQGQVSAVGAKLAADYPKTNLGTVTNPAEPRSMAALRHSQLDAATRSRTTLISAVLFGATAIVLLSACASAGGLLLSRATARAREVGVRSALGANRWRLARQLLTESVAISLVGGALGLLFSHWTSGVTPSFFAADQAALLDPRLSLDIFLFTLAISVLAGGLFGLAPAVLATNPAVVLALRSDPAGIATAFGGRRLRAALVIGQIALATIMLAATLQLVRGLTSALSTDMSRSVQRVAAASLLLPGRHDNEVRGVRYRQAATAQLRRLPGIDAVEWVSALPLINDNWRVLRFERAGTSLMEYAELPITTVSTGYFAAMKIPLLAGRVFDDRDGIRAPAVIVINDVLAIRYFGDSTRAVGAVLHDARGQAVEIIGVVQSERYRTLQPPPESRAYSPVSQHYLARMSVLVRTSGDPAKVLDSVQRALQALDGDVVILKAATLDRHLSETLALERLTTFLVGSCGLMTLVLAVVGVYGIMADAVVRRMRELGVRVALGARPARIVQLVLAQGIRLATSGALVGFVGALGGARLLQRLVHGLEPLDPATFVAIPTGLGLMVIVAALVPLHRALRINPTVALRQE
jgi:putative ABC transport system permease protein